MYGDSVQIVEFNSGSCKVFSSASASMAAKTHGRKTSCCHSAVVLFLTHMDLCWGNKMHRKKKFSGFLTCYHYRAVYPNGFSEDFTTVFNNDLAFPMGQSIGFTQKSEKGGKLIAIIGT